MNPVALVVTGMLVLAACGPTATETEMGRLAAVIKFSDARLRTCNSQIMSNPEYMSLSAVMPLGDGQRPTLDQKANVAFATQADIEAIGAWHRDYERCRSLMLETVQSVVPAGAAPLQDMFDQRDKVLLSLVRKQVSFGRANEQMDDITQSAHASLRAAVGEIDAQMQARYQAEIAERATIAAAIAEVVARSADAASGGRYGGRPPKRR